MTPRRLLLLRIYTCCFGAIITVYVIIWSRLPRSRNDVVFRIAYPPRDYTEEIHTTLVDKCKNELKTEINCQKFFTDGNHETGEPSTQKFISNECSFSKLVRNCSSLIKAHEYITDVINVSREECTFPLAFTIKIHKSPDQMEQLFRNIYRPHNVYCIHVDKKTNNQIYRDVQRLGSCFPNVFVPSERVDVVYRSITMLDAEFLCMKNLFKSPVRWKYYINLAGQDFPLKTNLEIVRILRSLKGRNAICSQAFPEKTRSRLD